MNKRNLMFILGLLSFVFLISMVSGALTLQTPVAGGNHTGVMALNCSTDNVTTIGISLAEGVNITYNASGGRADTVLVTIVGAGTENNSFSASAQSISALSDTRTYNFSCLMWNATTVRNATSATGITVDNTAPVCTNSIDRNVVSVNTGIPVVTAQSSTDALTSITSYSWILYRGDNTQSQTSTNDTPSFSLDDFDRPDEFTLALSVRDLVGLNTSCTNLSILVQGTEDSSSDTIVSQQQQASIISRIGGTRTMIIGAGVFVVILMAFVVIVLSKTKKGRR